MVNISVSMSVKFNHVSKKTIPLFRSKTQSTERQICQKKHQSYQKTEQNLRALPELIPRNSTVAVNCASPTFDHSLAMQISSTLFSYIKKIKPNELVNRKQMQEIYTKTNLTFKSMCGEILARYRKHFSCF